MKYHSSKYSDTLLIMGYFKMFEIVPLPTLQLTQIDFCGKKLHQSYELKV